MKCYSDAGKVGTWGLKIGFYCLSLGRDPANVLSDLRTPL